MKDQEKQFTTYVWKKQTAALSVPSILFRGTPLSCLTAAAFL